MFKDPFKSLRIDVVFFFGFALIVTILVGIVITVTYVNGSRDIAENTSYYQQKLLIELHKKLNTNLVDIEQSSSTASQNFSSTYEELLGDVDNYDRVTGQADIRRQLNNYVFSMPLLQSIHVYSDLTPSYNLQEFVQFLSLDSLEKEEWYDLLRNSDYTWLSGRTIQSNNGEVQVISFARKVYNRFNRANAVMVFNVRMSNFKEIIATDDARSKLALFDDTGKLITSTGDTAFFLENSNDIKHQIDMNSTGSKRTGDELLVWSSSLSSKWSLVEITSWTELMQGSLQETQIILGLGIVSIIMILLLAIFLSRKFVRPIAMLLNAMNNFSLSKRTTLPTGYKNEFGRLFQGYEKLTLRIDELYDSLEQQHERQRVSEIKALQMMINPHFLYNSLDQVNWMAIEAGQHQISNMLSYLGQFFRLSLSNTNHLIMVREELAHIESYLSFQRIRWQDRLKFQFEVDEEIKNWYVPKVILQPFIENAFIHGFHGKKEALLMISLKQVDKALEITITDDGCELPNNWHEQRSARGGYGLRNVRERIEALFGAEYGFQLMPSSYGGTQAVIRLPIVTSLTSQGEDSDVENCNY
ncbi:sensor histidine kinase [Paenibacillus senegalimassiliensis]|uniref:sensor histidine kinase n=1 Tax=Paenibacillus senegalimassiliensis TaxID=1737426 RepID=UPI00073F2797|nr:sensor histidine kinase [Paenibacillus senegalimassiliensis]